MIPFADLKTWDIFGWNDALYQKRSETEVEQLKTGRVLTFSPTERVRRVRPLKPVIREAV